MEVHTFRAATLQEALELVRKNLGPDASVLQTREATSNRLGLFTKRFVEVKAHSDLQGYAPASDPYSTSNRMRGKVIEQPPPPDSNRPSPAATTQAGVDTQSVSKSSNARSGDQLQGYPHVDRTTPTGAGHFLVHSIDQIEAAQTADATADQKDTSSVDSKRPRVEVNASGITHDSAAQSPSNPTGEQSAAVDRTDDKSQPAAMIRIKDESSAVILQLFSELTEAGIDTRTAKEVIRAACDSFADKIPNDHLTLHGRIAKQIAESLTIGGAIEVSRDQQRVVAFIGPTGAGKTTCIGKIAGSFRFDLGLQVGLITLDTFRNGSVDQLLQFAELVAAPLEVVSSPDQVIGAMQRLRECDLVLLDTTGRSPRDAEQMALLGEFLTAAEPDTIQLVLSATSSPEHAADAIEHYSLLQPTHLVLTKLDEAVAFGAWLPLLRSMELPISYLTAGQDVPRDLLVATARRVAQSILNLGQWGESSSKT